MIVKPQQKPYRLLMDEALLRRLPPTHNFLPSIRSNYAKGLAGYKGECNSIYYLKKLPQDKLSIYFNLRLPATVGYFEMDAFLLTPAFAVIIEIKNISGTLHFDTKAKQLVRSKFGTEQGFADPLLQVEEQKEQLQHFLSEFCKLDNFPIYAIVAISDTETSIKTTHPSERAVIFNQVMHFPAIKSRYNEWRSKHHHVTLPPFKITQLQHQLLHYHQPFFPTIYDSVKQTDILPGVYCEHCQWLSMEWIRRRWRCKCGHVSTNAHEQAIYDYLLLIQPHIHSSDCMHFLKLRNRYIARRFLQDMPLTKAGSGNMQYYFQDAQCISIAHTT